MTANPLDAYLNADAAADALGVSTSRVRQLCIAGDLSGHKITRRAWLIHRDEVARFKSEKRAAKKKADQC